MTPLNLLRHSSPKTIARGGSVFIIWLIGGAAFMTAVAAIDIWQVVSLGLPLTERVLEHAGLAALGIVASVVALRWVK